MIFLGLLMGTQVIFAEPVIKEVCKPVTDKSGATKTQCKKIKVHKKLEGTEIPTKK